MEVSAFRKREDLQKRINAYYQGIRDAEVGFRSTYPTNATMNLYITTPVSRVNRRQTMRSEMQVYDPIMASTRLESESPERLHTAGGFSQTGAGTAWS